MSTSKRERRQSKERPKKKTTRKARLTCVQSLIWYIHFIVDTIVDFIYGLLYDDANRRLLAPIKHAYLVESATSLADKIRNKELSSETLVKSCIQRIEDVNIDLNCVVDTRFERALEEAKKVDEMIASGKMTKEELKLKKPFLGVPFTSKESTHAAGMSNTFGLVSRRGYRASENADVVTRVLQGGGGILLAVTNVPELNLWQETRNNVFGQTNNPFNVNRHVGGSSGGEAAAIAACASPFGIGTDVGGSCRMPAFYCGIFGHKPTTGLISTKGMTWRTGKEKGTTMVTAGTLTRCAEDIAPFLKLLLAENVDKLQLDTKVDLKKVRLCYVVEPSDARVSAVDQEMRAVMLQATAHLEEECANEAKLLNLPGFRYSYSLWRYWMTKETGNFAYDLGNRKCEISPLVEIPKMLVGQSQFTVPSMLKLLETGVFPPVPARWAEEETEKLRTALLAELGTDGVLLFPSAPSPATHHCVPFFRPYNFAYWAVINVLQLPVTQVPLGLSKKGLPIGLQVVAAPYNDHLTIAVASELERAFGGFVPPCAVSHA